MTAHPLIGPYGEPNTQTILLPLTSNKMVFYIYGQKYNMVVFV